MTTKLFELHSFEGVQGAYAKDQRVRHYVEQMEGKLYTRHEKTLEKEKQHWSEMGEKKDETPKKEMKDHGWDRGHLY